MKKPAREMLDVKTMLQDSRFEVARLRDDVTLLPEKSNYRVYALRSDPYFLVHRGDLSVETLTLDFNGIASDDERNFCGLVVDGNLTVAQWVWSEETDGALGLMVSGDMRSQNLVVGGQEIWVKGNLEVAQVLWGTYNHGELMVEGTLRAALIVQDDYRIEAGRGVVAARRLDASTEATELKRWLSADCFFDDEEGLYRQAAIERLRDSKTLLRKPLPLPTHSPLALKATASSVEQLFALPVLRTGFLSLRVEEADVVLSARGAVEISHDERHCLLMTLDARKQLAVQWLDLTDPRSKPKPVDKRTPKAFLALRDVYWPLVVTEVEKRALTAPEELSALAQALKREVSVTRIDRIMKLAMVRERYRDSHATTSHSGYQRDGRLFAFTLETEDTGPAIEVLHERDDSLVEPFRKRGDPLPLTGHQFGIVEDSRGTRRTCIRYVSNTHTEVHELDVRSRSALYAALAAWRALWAGVFDDNEAYLRGEHVDD